MPKIFLNCFNAFISIRINCVSFSIYQSTKLNNELLKGRKVKLLCFSFVEKFNIDISDQISYLVLICQKE